VSDTKDLAENGTAVTPPQAEKQYYRIKVLHSSESQICGWKSGDIEPGATVVVNSRYGRDLGKILGVVCSKRIQDKKSISDIIRMATEKDTQIYEKNLDREREAMQICREKVREHKLDMKLVSAHFLSEESKVLFFFTADERVDFRELVKDLVGIFKMRIELRQIGVRDESRVLGGLAVCGRAYCCHGITDKLKPVSIKMAKEQNLSLNSMKISGSCGRLLCCLSYEYDFYKEEKGKLPSEGSRLKVNNIPHRIQEVNLLTKTIRLSSSEGGYRDLPFCSFTRHAETNQWEVESVPDEE
jgi:cell fate regulator YaaT (PSP1 superfamily)